MVDTQASIQPNLQITFEPFLNNGFDMFMKKLNSSSTKRSNSTDDDIIAFAPIKIETSATYGDLFNKLFNQELNNANFIIDNIVFYSPFGVIGHHVLLNTPIVKPCDLTFKHYIVIKMRSSSQPGFEERLTIKWPLKAYQQAVEQATNYTWPPAINWNDVEPINLGGIGLNRGITYPGCLDKTRVYKVEDDNSYNKLIIVAYKESINGDVKQTNIVYNLLNFTRFLSASINGQIKFVEGINKLLAEKAAKEEEKKRLIASTAATIADELISSVKSKSSTLASTAGDKLTTTTLASTSPPIVDKQHLTSDRLKSNVIDALYGGLNVNNKKQNKKQDKKLKSNESQLQVQAQEPQVQTQEQLKQDEPLKRLDKGLVKIYEPLLKKPIPNPKELLIKIVKDASNGSHQRLYDACQFPFYEVVIS